MNINQISNISFNAKYLYLGDKKNLDKIAQDCESHSDKEYLYLRPFENDILLVATSNDAKTLRKSKEIPNFADWLEALKNLNSSYINNVCKFIFKSDHGVVICQADKSLEPADKIEDGEIKFIDDTKLFVHNKKNYAKQFQDGRIEYYTEQGKIKTIEFPDGSKQDNYYNSSCKDLLFTRITKPPKNYIESNSITILSDEGIVDYSEQTVTFIKSNGAIIVYDFEGNVIETDNIRETKPNWIFKEPYSF